MKKEHKQLYQRIVEEQPYCLMCGSTSYLHIHHIIYKGMANKREELTYYENLIRLCNNCHLLVHSNKKKYTPILQDIRKDIK